MDTKQLSKGLSQKPEERLAVTVTGNGNEQFLGFPAIKSGSGKHTADGVYAELEKWGINNSIKCISYDTTASNSGIRNGAVTLLEKRLGRKLLHFPCRHHILELLLQAVFNEALRVTSTSPDVNIFRRFQKFWSEIDCSSYEAVDTSFDLSKDDKLEIQSKATRLLDSLYSRADYREMLLLTLLFIGVDEYNGTKIKVKSPGNFKTKLRFKHQQLKYKFFINYRCNTPCPVDG